MMAGFDRAETCWLDQRFCVYQPDTNALCLLNSEAGAYWEARSSGVSAQSVCDDIAARHGLSGGQVFRDFSLLEEGWSDARLLWDEGGKPAHRAPVIGDVQSADLPGRSCVDLPFELDACYRQGRGGLFRLMVDEPELAELLEAVLAPLRVVDLHELDVDGALVIRSIDREYGLWREGQMVLGPVDRATARRVALRNVLFHIWPASMVGGMIHGAAIAGADGRAVVLAGSSGAGKSTLAAGAISAGWTYLSDDLVPVLRCGKRIGRFDTALSVKSGSWSLLQGRLPQLNCQPELAMGPRRVRYLPLEPDQIGPPDAQVGAIIFPKLNSEAALEGQMRLEPLSSAQVLEQLIESGSGPDGQPHTILPMLDLVRSVPGFALHYSELDDGICLMSEALG